MIGALGPFSKCRRCRRVPVLVDERICPRCVEEIRTRTESARDDHLPR